MITIKTPEEIALMREGGRILADAIRAVAAAVKPGVTPKELDDIAREYLIAHGGRPSFLGYGGSSYVMPYPSSLCVSINDEVVHGIGTRDVILKEGDIVGLDLGVQYPANGGLYTDHAITVPVGKVSKEAQALIDTTRETLNAVIALVKPGVYVHELSQATQQFGESHGYSLVRDLTGHGVGHKVHEEPPIFCYYEKGMPKVRLTAGMVIAIEPMVNMGTWRVKTDPDGWTIRTSDGKLSAHFEHTIAITETGHEVLTV